MSAVAIETQTNSDFDELKTRLKTTWMAGNYDLFSRFMEKDAEQFFRRLGVTPGTGYWTSVAVQGTVALATGGIHGPRGRRGI